MKKILIVTGANRGLGKALVDLGLQDNETIIISISRSINSEHLNVPANKMIFIPVDLESSFSSDKFCMFDSYITEESSLFFINNAGIIVPIERIGKLKQDDITRSIKVNVEFPINLINWLLNKYPLNRIILVNVTSGASYNPIASWSLYCSSKAFVQIFFKVLSEENADNEKLLIYSIDPGTMDTGMQANIRANDFPKREYFQMLQEKNNLIDPADAATKILKDIKFRL
jgi:benzil reductase ((S)-benzoin forming)